MIGSASADDSESRAAFPTQIVLSDEGDITVAGLYDDYYYSPASTCGFWGKGCGSGGGYYHHRGGRGV
jgi:hypothetical protein